MASVVVTDHKPVVILVRPQMGENIGAAARAMMNCGLVEMRIVAPRDGWPNEAAIAMASGAESILEEARIFDDLPDAVADLHFVAASTARHRDMNKPVVNQWQLADEMIVAGDSGLRCGLLFGAERSGLENDEVVLADKIVQVPLNPVHNSLNLGQAVLLIGYAWFERMQQRMPQDGCIEKGLATKEEIENFFGRLIPDLEKSGFLGIEEKKPKMVRNIRNIFQRASLTSIEVSTLHGIVESLKRL
jgi:tRNA/rRNA methyltransferase